MKKKLFAIALTTLSVSTLMAVEVSKTDLKNEIYRVYGEQLKNSTFNGDWETTNNEPADASWHSFNTSDTDGLTGSAKTKDQSGSSTTVRPGSPANSLSAKINAREFKVVFFTAFANGNMTTGKIQCGTGITANDLTDKYNRTVRNDSKYNTPFESKPDSVSVWVNFTTNSDNNFARMSVILHDDTRDTQDAPSSEADRNTICGMTERAFNRVEAGGSGQWMRISVPFDYYPGTYTSFSNFSNSSGTATYNLANVDPKYILVTFTTNKDAGKGHKNDVLLFDDMLMIYNPFITSTQLTTGTLTEMIPLKANFDIEGTFFAYNDLAKVGDKAIGERVVTVGLQQSDANGNFANTTDNIIATKEIAANGSYSFNQDIAKSLAEGDYKFRVINTTHGKIGEPIALTRELNLSISNANAGTVSGGGKVIIGQTVRISTTPANAGYRFVNWTKDNVEYSTEAEVDVTVSETTNIIANYEIVPFTITYNNVAGVTNTNTTSYTVEDETITLVEVTKDHYTFDGWYTNDELTEKVTSIAKGSTGNKELYAKWVANNYLITYLNVENATNTNPTTYTIESDNIELNNANKDGYNFKGWFANEELTESTTSIEKGSTGDKTFYAKWEEISTKLKEILNAVKITPNPATHLIQITGMEVSEAIVTDINGKRILHVYPQNGQIVVSSLENGNYLLQLKSTNNQEVSTKLVIRK